MAKQPDWKIRKGRWPNGREYWNVAGPNGALVGGKRGGVATFYDRDAVRAVADEMNGKPKQDSGPQLLEGA